MYMYICIHAYAHTCIYIYIYTYTYIYVYIYIYIHKYTHHIPMIEPMQKRIQLTWNGINVKQIPESKATTTNAYIDHGLKYEFNANNH